MTKIFILSFLMISTAYTAQNAKVLVIRGNVTKLLPGKSHAKAINKGDLLPENTSVLTKEKSMVRLLFADGTTINLGPMSKIIISDLPKVNANVISLLTGTINASVNKNGNDKTKLLVKTRNSVMGVRGTKFKTGFNPINSNTSLVTIEGNVAIAKVKDQKENALITDSSKLDEELNQSEVIEVKAGKYSDVKSQVERPSVPVKIAPAQYDALALQAGSSQRAQDVMKTDDAQIEVKSHLNKGSAKQDAYRPGGYIDFATGLYVAPGKDAQIDKKTGTFIATKQVGVINANGEYKAPKGIKLDAKKGFILASNSKKVDKEVLANLESLQEKKETKIKWVKQHILSLRYEPLMSGYKTGKNYYKSKNSSNTLFSYEQIWNEKWESGIFIGDKRWDLDRSASHVRNDDGKDGKSTTMLDLRYNINAKYKLGLSLINESMPIIQENPSFEEYFVDMDDFGGISAHLTYSFNEAHSLNLRYKNFFESDIHVMDFSGFGGEDVNVSIQTLKISSLNTKKISKNLDFIYDLSYEIFLAEIKNYDDVSMETLSLALGLKWSI